MTQHKRSPSRSAIAAQLARMYSLRYMSEMSCFVDGRNYQLHGMMVPTAWHTIREYDPIVQLAIDALIHQSAMKRIGK